MSAEEYSAGFDRGNYCAAYEATSIDDRHELAWSGDWREGFVMGFFSSYELHEVPDDWREVVKYLRAKWQT